MVRKYQQLKSSCKPTAENGILTVIPQASLFSLTKSSNEPLLSNSSPYSPRLPTTVASYSRTVGNGHSLIL